MVRVGIIKAGLVWGEPIEVSLYKVTKNNMSLECHFRTNGGRNLLVQKYSQQQFAIYRNLLCVYLCYTKIDTLYSFIICLASLIACSACCFDGVSPL